jgi:hypothetical protein
MIASDPKRAEIVISLIVDRHETAEPAFQDFLRDIKVSADALGQHYARGRRSETCD